MSVKHAILGLLYTKPRYGYELKVEFEQLFHKQWPLNIGQIYTTLDRLVRDHFVAPFGEDGNDRKEYSILPLGKEEFHEWLMQPVESSLFKHDFFFKYLCAKKVSFADAEAMIAQQKTNIIQSVLHLTKLKNQLNPNNDQDMILLAEGGILHLEADLKWLELIS